MKGVPFLLRVSFDVAEDASDLKIRNRWKRKQGLLYGAVSDIVKWYIVVKRNNSSLDMI